MVASSGGTSASSKASPTSGATPLGCSPSPPTAPRSPRRYFTPLSMAALTCLSNSLSAAVLTFSFGFSLSLGSPGSWARPHEPKSSAAAAQRTARCQQPAKFIVIPPELVADWLRDSPGEAATDYYGNGVPSAQTG